MLRPLPDSLVRIFWIALITDIVIVLLGAILVRGSLGVLEI